MRDFNIKNYYVKASVVIIVVLAFILPGPGIIGKVTQSNISKENSIFSHMQVLDMIDRQDAIILEVIENRNNYIGSNGALIVTVDDLACGSCLQTRLQQFECIFVYSKDDDLQATALQLLEEEDFNAFEISEIENYHNLLEKPINYNGLEFPDENHISLQLSNNPARVSGYVRNDRIRRVYGEAFSHGTSPEESANAFLQANANIFDAEAHDLELQNIQPIMYNHDINDYKFLGLNYIQEINDVPVYRSRLILLVRNEDGYPLVLASSDLHDMSAYDGKSQFDEVSALKGILTVQNTWPTLVEFSQPESVIWAGVDDTIEEPLFSFMFIGESDSLDNNGFPEKRLFITDAITGEILYSENLILFVDVEGNVQGMATQGRAADFCEEELPEPMRWARVNILSQIAYTDGIGDFIISNAGSTPVTVQSRLWGNWFRVYNYSGTDTLLENYVTPPGPANFMYNEPNVNERTRAEVNGYLQANIVRDFTLTYNPSYPGLQQNEFPVWVNRDDGYCPGNAWYDYSSINFCRSGSGYPNTAWSSIIHHEYGHHLVAEAGSGQGQYGEGMGDTMGLLILDEPGTGWGFFGNCNEPLRTADNTIQYPCSGAIHYCGQLLSGCVWDTRNELAISNPSNYMDILANLAINAMLVHTGETIDPSITIDYLVLDDNNGNIYDGTPHYQEIATGFGAHNMDAPELALLGFEFPNGLPDVVSPGGGTTLRVEVYGISANPEPGTGIIYVDSGSGFDAIPMVEVDINIYDATFPAAPCVSEIFFYFTADTTLGSTQYWPPGAPSEYYTTVAAYTADEIFTDNFETDLGWTVENDPYLTDGAWGRGIPIGGGDRGDPPTDYDGSGRCYLTDNVDDNSDVDGGITWLISPTFDLSGSDDALVRYALWYTNNFGGDPNNDLFKTYVSNDNGASWVLAETIGPVTPLPENWYEHSFLVSNFVTLNNQIKVRFEASDLNDGSVVEAGIDDFHVIAYNCDSSALLIEGYCYYQNMSPADTVAVEIINLDTSERWQANTMNNYYSLLLNPGDDVSEGETLRFIARDGDESISILEHLVTSIDISNGFVEQDLILDIHYRDLKDYPWYIETVDSGAAVMKMMMDYLMWNKTIHPDGPPDVWSEQQLWDDYSGADWINGSELASGLNNEIDDHNQGWIYGYFFNPSYNESSIEILKRICYWIDYPVDYYNDYRSGPDVPKPGHPNHVPVAVPTYGDYTNWMSVRGIHTDKDTWPPNDVGEFIIYGFWLNDPAFGGVGDNIYVTIQRFLDTYFTALEVPGDRYDGMYLAITDPPRDIAVDIPEGEITIAETTRILSQRELFIVRWSQLGSIFANIQANNIIIDAAYTQTSNVLQYDDIYGELFGQATSVGAPRYQNGEYLVTFKNRGIAFDVTLNKNADLLEFHIDEKNLRGRE